MSDGGKLLKGKLVPATRGVAGVFNEGLGE